MEGKKKIKLNKNQIWQIRYCFGKDLKANGITIPSFYLKPKVYLSGLTGRA